MQQETILVYIPELRKNYACWYLNENQFEGSFEALAQQLPAHKQAILILGGESVYHTQAELSHLNSSQMARAAPYVLEEELSEDIIKLHFAYGEHQKISKTQVLVVDKAAFSELLQNMADLNLQFTACYVDYQLIDSESDNWCGLLDKDTIIMSTGSSSGFKIPVSQWSTILQLADPQPKTVKIRYFKTKPCEDICVNTSVECIEKQNETLLQQFFKGLESASSKINLFQHAFKQTTKFKQAKKYWYLAAGSLALWLLVVFVTTFISYFYYHHETQKLKQEIKSLYTQVFPDATEVVSPKIRLERALAQYQSSGSDNGFLQIIGKIGPVLKQFSNIDVTDMTFNNNRLFLDITGNGFQDLERLSNAAQKAGLQVSQTNAKTQSKGVSATFAVSLMEAAS